MSFADVIEVSRVERPRKERLRLALAKCQKLILFYLYGPKPNGDMAREAHQQEYENLLECREDLAQNVFPDGDTWEEFVVDDDYSCEECGGRGHIDCCRSLNVWDLGDCLAKCEGCCPNECQEWGLDRVATVAKHRMMDLLSNDAERRSG